MYPQTDTQKWLKPLDLQSIIDPLCGVMKTGEPGEIPFERGQQSHCLDPNMNHSGVVESGILWWRMNPDNSVLIHHFSGRLSNDLKIFTKLVRKS